MFTQTTGMLKEKLKGTLLYKGIHTHKEPVMCSLPHCCASEKVVVMYTNEVFTSWHAGVQPIYK